MQDLTNEQLEMLVNLTEARILKISKDDLRMSEDQLLWSDELEKEVLNYWTQLNKYWDEKKLPPCTCLDHEGGFLGKRTKQGKIYNDFFWNETPCSIEWYNKCKADGAIKGFAAMPREKRVAAGKKGGQISRKARA
mgnify:CR=1 FL=1